MHTAFPILGVLGLAAPAFAQTADVLGEFGGLLDDLTIAEQKAKGDVLQAILDADRLAQSSRPKAVERLKQALSDLEAKVAVGATAKASLSKQLQGKIDTYAGRAVIELPKADPAKVKQEAQAAMINARLETDDVTRGLKKVADLLDANKNGEATLEISKLTLKYPNNPAVLSLRGANLTQNNLATWRKLQEELASAWVADQQNLLAMATPIAGEIKFPNPEKWKQITELRRNAHKLKLSEREEAILKSLNTTVAVIVKDRPFQEALQEFSNQIKQEIHLDTKSLEDAGLDLNRKTNFTGNVSARTALRALLQPQGLTFVVKGEIIQVVTLEKAERDMLTTRSYDVSDLVDTGGQFSNAVQWGPALSYQQTMQNADAIVTLIRDSVDPRCWKDKGGFCTIQFHLPTKSIVVRASTEVHAALGGAVVGN